MVGTSFRLLALGAIAAVLAAIPLRSGISAQPRPVHAALQPDRVVHIQAGWFVMGSDEPDLEHAMQLCALGQPKRRCQSQLFAHETPARRVFVGSFTIDRTEVSRAAYRRCEQDHGCVAAQGADGDPRLGHAVHPVVYVDAAQAAGYCAWLGGRLPTEAEWERAARGGSHRRFPWGQHYNSRVANHGSATGEPDPVDGFTHAAPVSALPEGRSAHGLLNMAGNVWEWTADYYNPDYYQQAVRVDPAGPEGGPLRVVRGGSWRSPPHAIRAAARAALASGERRPDVGFRCAYD